MCACGEAKIYPVYYICALSSGSMGRLVAMVPLIFCMRRTKMITKGDRLNFKLFIQTQSYDRSATGQVYI